jgi:hypothetical protein
MGANSTTREKANEKSSGLRARDKQAPLQISCNTEK